LVLLTDVNSIKDSPMGCMVRLDDKELLLLAKINRLFLLNSNKHYSFTKKIFIIGNSFCFK
jgi:hypothetical protein